MQAHQFEIVFSLDFGFGVNELVIVNALLLRLRYQFIHPYLPLLIVPDGRQSQCQKQNPKQEVQDSVTTGGFF